MNDVQRTESILSELKHNYISYSNLHGDNEQGCRIIEEQLQRSIPKKPIFNKDYFIYKCPICKEVVYYRQSCGNNKCRQAIDWGYDYSSYDKFIDINDISHK